VVTRCRQRGFTLLEITISMTIFAVFLAIFFTLTSEMRQWEKKLPTNFMRHPQVMAVISRMRRDVQDVFVPPGSSNNPYLPEYGGLENSPKRLIFETVRTDGTETIIWDFTEPTVARRISYKVGVKSVWVARGLPPDFAPLIEAEEFPGRPYGVRLKAKDNNGTIAIDQILQPRAHQ
jgi:prepilin-type N-terminal cleavage/methylation domain-containing protein